MSYNPVYEASKALPVEHIAKELEEFAAAGQDLSRRRFSRSPPPVPSVPSTEYEESEPPSPGAQLRDKERKELQNSRADAQFIIQIDDELGRIRAARDKDLLQQPNLFDWEEAAEANVKYRWMQQGIWDERWASQPGKIWKHELRDSPPPVRPSKSVKDGGVSKLRTKRKRQPCDLEEEYQEIVRCAIGFQNRQSSRPCYQFIYQFDKEREWIKMGLSTQDQDQLASVDTRAYENLKSRWIRDGIWDDDWALIPGTSWRHERPPKYPSPQEIFRRADAHKAATMERAERPPRWYFMASSLEYRTTAPLTITNRLSNPPVSLKASSDPSSPNVVESSSKVVPSPEDRSTTSRSPQHTGFPGSTRKSTAKAKPNAKGQDHDEPQTRSAAKETPVKPTKINPKKKALQKQKVEISSPCISELRLVKIRTSGNKEENRPPIPVAIQGERAKDATASRPRRAAASKAMKNLMKASLP